MEVAPPRRTSSVEVRREDKELFDALQAWWLLRHGERLTQWELFTVLLVEALEGEGGRLRGFRAG